jgi:hypothetical protein
MCNAMQDIGRAIYRSEALFTDVEMVLPPEGPLCLLEGPGISPCDVGSSLKKFDRHQLCTQRGCTWQCTYKVEASIPVKISSCSCLETRSPLTKNIQRK